MEALERRHTPKPRGFTLVEIMVGTAVALVVVAAAFAFASHQTKVLEHTQMALDVDQASRGAMALLASDIRKAGTGLGYTKSATGLAFAGLRLGSFTVRGGAQFNSSDQTVQLAWGRNTDSLTGNYTSTSDDIGLRLFLGTMRTIADFAAGTGQVCAGGDFAAGDIVVMMTEDGSMARTATLDSIDAAGACTNGVCLGNCQSFTWSEDTEGYESDPRALTAHYQNGEMGGDYAEIVWFVLATNGVGELRRAEITASTTCASRSASCGAVVADNFETLQMRVYEWDSTSATWSDRTDAQTFTGQKRIRVDIEVVARARTSVDAPFPPIDLRLEPGVTAPPGGRDQLPRHVLRTSVEIRNSGRMLSPRS